MTKVYASNLDLQQKILNGINKLADNVAVTLGPKGRNVILAKKEGKDLVISFSGIIGLKLYIMPKFKKSILYLFPI